MLFILIVLLAIALMCKVREVRRLKKAVDFAWATHYERMAQR